MTSQTTAKRKNKHAIKHSVLNGTSYRKNGWKYVAIHGEPAERGYAYGYLCAEDFAEVQRILSFLMMEAYGHDWAFFVEHITADFKQMTQKKFPEFYQEMEGIARGVCAAGGATTVDEIIAWNFYCSIPYWFSSVAAGKDKDSDSQSHFRREGGGAVGGSVGAFTGAKDRCSAFMAVGDWTVGGDIVCAHNSFADFIDGQFAYIVLSVQPAKGHAMIMQTSPCWIWSGTDFFITTAGIIGTETTIGGFVPYEKRYPIGYRIRQAMQYGNTLDEYCQILLRENSGDYANSWLFGDIHGREILRIELGLKYHNIERTRNGVFIGFNAPYDERIRNLEVQNSGFYDIRRHQGARKVRLGELMKKYKGRLNCATARRIIADHYDVYLKKQNPCSRTVCSHYDLDPREFMSQADRPPPFAPRGALDGIVCDGTMAKRMSFWGRYGNSCGMAFNAKKYCQLHTQFDKFCPFLYDRPSQPWTEWGAAGAAATTVTGKSPDNSVVTSARLPVGNNNQYLHSLGKSLHKHTQASLRTRRRNASHPEREHPMLGEHPRQMPKTRRLRRHRLRR